MKRSSSVSFAFAYSIVLVALASAGCSRSAKSPADALMMCGRPDQTCRLVFDGGDESACQRLSSGALVCSSVARAD